MNGEKSSRAIRWLSRRMGAEGFGEKTDRQLVEHFLSHRDEAVFEVLVRRHGSMVYRVCWRVLQQVEDTEDAFQATFLVLAQKLETVRKRDSLASWLHGVAHRVALKARSLAALRRKHETIAPNSMVVPPDDLTWKELRSVLDAELLRLPEKWRQPLVLCYLEGRTQDEAANHLGWSGNTLRRRLEEARSALGRTLGRKGFGPAALATVLVADCTSSGVALPASIKVDAVIAAATKQVAGGFVSPHVTILSEGVLRAMSSSYFKSVIVLVVLGTIGTIGSAWYLEATGSPPLPVEKSGSTGMDLPKAGPASPVVKEEAPQKTTGPQKLKSDMELLQGRWDLLESRQNGETVEYTRQPNAFLIVENEQFRLGSIGEGGGWLMMSTFKLNPTTSPKNINLTTGNSKNEDLFGIYRLDGDELTICWPSEGPFDSRPIGFKSEKGSKMVVYKLKRHPKPEKLTFEEFGIRLQQAEKDFRTADYYERTGHPGSALFYYERLEKQSKSTLADLQAKKNALEEQIKKEEDAARNSPAKPSTEKLQGNWLVTEIRRNGETTLSNDREIGRLTIKGERFQLVFDKPGESGDLSYTFRLNIAKSPRHLDLVGSNAPEEQVLWLGIYKLEDDELTLCLPIAEPWDRRPGTFTAERGSNQEIYKLKRSKGR